MTKQKPTVYLDTNIPSVLCNRGSNIETIHQQMLTRDSWESERESFRVYAPVFTEGELSRGIYRGQEQALKMVRRLRYLPFTTQTEIGEPASRMAHTVLGSSEPIPRVALGQSLRRDVDEDDRGIR